jgi:hypothetical protein
MKRRNLKAIRPWWSFAVPESCSGGWASLGLPGRPSVIADLRDISVLITLMLRQTLAKLLDIQKSFCYCSRTISNSLLVLLMRRASRHAESRIRG